METPEQLVKIGGPQRRADRQPPLDVGQLGGGEGIPERPRWIAPGSVGGQLPHQLGAGASILYSEHLATTQRYGAIQMVNPLIEPAAPAAVTPARK